MPAEDKVGGSGAPDLLGREGVEGWSEPPGEAKRRRTRGGRPRAPLRLGPSTWA